MSSVIESYFFNPSIEVVNGFLVACLAVTHYCPLLHGYPLSHGGDPPPLHTKLPSRLKQCRMGVSSLKKYIFLHQKLLVVIIAL